MYAKEMMKVTRLTLFGIVVQHTIFIQIWKILKTSKIQVENWESEISHCIFLFRSYCSYINAPVCWQLKSCVIQHRKICYYLSLGCHTKKRCSWLSMVSELKWDKNRWQKIAKGRPMKTNIYSRLWKWCKLSSWRPAVFFSKKLWRLWLVKQMRSCLEVTEHQR